MRVVLRRQANPLHTRINTWYPHDCTADNPDEGRPVPLITRTDAVALCFRDNGDSLNRYVAKSFRSRLTRGSSGDNGILHSQTGEGEKWVATRGIIYKVRWTDVQAFTPTLMASTQTTLCRFFSQLTTAPRPRLHARASPSLPPAPAIQVKLTRFYTLVPPPPRATPPPGPVADEAPPSATRIQAKLPHFFHNGAMLRGEFGAAHAVHRLVQEYNTRREFLRPRQLIPREVREVIRNSPTKPLPFDRPTTSVQHLANQRVIFIQAALAAGPLAELRPKQAFSTPHLSCLVALLMDCSERARAKAERENPALRDMRTEEGTSSGVAIFLFSFHLRSFCSRRGLQGASRSSCGCIWCVTFVSAPASRPIYLAIVAADASLIFVVDEDNFVTGTVIFALSLPLPAKFPHSSRKRRSWILRSPIRRRRGCCPRQRPRHQRPCQSRSRLHHLHRVYLLSV